MIDENGRPGRIAGDHKLISELIALNEANAVLMTDAELEAERESCRAECVVEFPKIAAAQAAYQHPSQAFYVYDRTINRRRLHRENAEAE